MNSSSNHKFSKLLEPLSTTLAASGPRHWADLGCGNGVFTALLAELLPAKSTITAIDQNNQQLPPVMGSDVSVAFLQANFADDDLPLPPLNGILMANSLHYVKDKPSLIHRLEKHFAGPKQWLIVEYNTQQSNRWVPYPIDYTALKKLFTQLGYRHIEKTGEQPSVYQGSMYAAFITSDSQ